MEPNIGTEGYTALGGRTEENRRLAAENARLREALEFISYTQNIQAANDTARVALEGGK